jgi:cysteinyl-tRNA synthetase
MTSVTPPLKLYDNFERAHRVFTPQQAGTVSLYSCGPTVYDYQHIGNMRTYMFVDGLKRVLRLNGYTLNHVMNITDVGHLTSDADTGEDKMEKGSKRTGLSAWSIAELYTKVFFEDLALLNVPQANIVCKATDHIPEQIAFIVDIEKNGYTYRTSDGIYFDTSKQASYGHLGRLDIAGLQAGSRVDLGEKRNATDYALWKFSTPDEKRQMEWDSPWGRGFPGWHIECSAMAQRYLGNFFDIHTGGEDHLTVHHVNEISQTEARVNTRLANYWMHGYFLQLGDEKMSKSKGEFLRVQSIIDRGYDPLVYRFLNLSAHYRSQMNFTWDAMDAAKAGFERLRLSVFNLGPDVGTPDAGFVARFMEKLNDDLNFPQALALLFEVMKSDLPAPSKKATVLKFDEAFGLRLSEYVPQSVTVPDAIQQLAALRWAAKSAKNWAEADKLRAEISAQGWEMKDAKSDYTLAPIAK